MKRQPIPETRAARVVAAIGARPGINRDELARELALPVRLVRVALLIASKAGSIGGVRVAKGQVQWYPAEQVPAAQARADEASRQALLAKRRRCQARRRAGLPKLLRPAPVDPGDAPIIRRHVEVGAPLPFRCTAPRSVFELGGSA